MPEANIDVTKVLFDSRRFGFKNNHVYTGSFSISGTLHAGTAVFTENITLEESPDMTQIMINGPTDTSGSDLDPRPGNAWFEEGYVWALGNDAGAGYTDYPMPFSFSSDINGNVVTLTFTAVQTFDASLVLTPITVYYRIVDYSVFSE